MQTTPSISWRKFPFLRFLVAFLFGIVSAYYFPNPKVAHLTLASLFVLFAILFVLHRWQKSSIRWALPFGVVLNGLLAALGYTLCYQQNQDEALRKIAPYVAGEQTYIAKLDDQAVLKGNRLEVPLQVLAVKDSLGNWVNVDLIVQAKLELDTNTTKLKYGDLIAFRSRLLRITAGANPHTFDAKTYYALHHIYYKSYIRAEHWQSLAQNRAVWWRSELINVRSYLLELLQIHLPTVNEHAVASALTLGAKKGLDQALRHAYADTGAMHVLAVSGLHVGLIAWLFSLLLVKRKKDSKWVKITKTIVLLLCIWGFAFLTGASASVMRASTMFSLLILGQESGRFPNVYNTLALTAFLLLLIDPYFIFDIGFQLSFLAVIGIVYLQPKLYRQIYIKNQLLDWIWSLTTVSIAAQLSTLPISWYYFHQFPVYFWLSGLVVIPLATLILPLALLLFLLGKISFLASFIGTMLYWVLWFMNSLIFTLSQFPMAVVDQIWISTFEVYLFYLIMISFLIAVSWSSKRFLALSLLAVIVFLGSWNYTEWKEHQQAELWIYKAHKGSVIDFIQGKEAVTLADSNLTNQQKNFINQPNLAYKGIENRRQHFFTAGDFSNAYLSIRGQYSQFRNLRLAFIDYKLPKKGAAQTIEVDYLFLRKNPKLYDLADLAKFYQFKQLIWDASSSYWWRNRWTEQAQRLGYPYIDIAKEGAICILPD